MTRISNAPNREGMAGTATENIQEPATTGGDGTADSESEPGHGGDALADKVQSLHALLDLMLADRAPTGTIGLSQREKGLLDRALYEVYRRAGISSDP